MCKCVDCSWVFIVHLTNMSVALIFSFQIFSAFYAFKNGIRIGLTSPWQVLLVLSFTGYFPGAIGDSLKWTGRCFTGEHLRRKTFQPQMHLNG